MLTTDGPTKIKPMILSDKEKKEMAKFVLPSGKVSEKLVLKDTSSKMLQEIEKNRKLLLIHNP